MAGKEAPKAEAAAPAEAKPKKKFPLQMIIVAAAVVVLEGATVGVMMMTSGGPKRAMADQAPTTQPAVVVEKDAEVPILDAKQDGKLPNSSSGHLYLYDIQVVAKVNDKDKEKVSGILTERSAEIRDKIRTIIASSEKKTLDEPGLETLRRQIAYQLQQDIGKDLIKELLIPKCTPYRAEF
jgi:flagellar basal body-associated protein FliL